jgi:hypothetical protein
MEERSQLPDPRVRAGQTVRDLDGKRLGKVTHCVPWGLEVVKGFWSPEEWVIRWDEILDVRDGEVHVARSDEALFELAAGKLPRTWSARGQRGKTP